MKYWLPLLLIILFTQNAIAQKKMQEPYALAFREADSLMNESGLPQSAVTILQGIYKKAKTAGEPVQMLKAQLYLMQAAVQYKEGADTNNIRTAVQEAKAMTFPYNAVWHSIAAQLYHNYYERHQWQILQRTALHKEGRQPIETWDAPHFFRVITQHYDASLDDAQALKNIDLKTFAPLLNGSTETRYLRPTLFDLLAFRAVDYYSNDEQGITRPAYQFTISDPAYLSDAAVFAKLNITSKDTSSRHLRALQLYQEILGMHAKDEAPDAAINADIQRLEFVYSHATFQDKKILYSKALNHLAARYPNDPTAAEARYRMLALQYETTPQPRGMAGKEKKQRNLVELKAALEAVARQFPKSEGGIHAQRLANEIALPTLAVQGEEAILPDEYSKVLVTYKNVPQVWGRVVKLSEEDYKKATGNDQNTINKLLLAAKPIQTFFRQMPVADDYETHTTELPIEPLGKGIYALLLSSNASFSESDNNLSYVLFQASNLSLITEQGKAAGYVLHRKTGKPLAGAQLEFYGQEWKNNTYNWVRKASAQSMANGSFIAAAKNIAANRTIIRYGDETYYADAGIYQYGYEAQDKVSTQTFFFTDRSIYRPGQTIYFKGIMVRKETAAQKTGVIARAATRVSFKDANGQEIKTLSLTTNEFGSFAGTFIAPQSGITGEMSIDNGAGSTSISVEEYKRPKFAVAFDTVKGSYALNEQVTVTGAATAYAGNVIDGATVKYRVVRETRWPYPWLYRRMITPPSADVEITNGLVTTDASGKFKITFTAQPDETVDTALQPLFNYTIYADVTDAAGETRTASETISAGYRGIRIVAEIPAKAVPKDLEKLAVRITNLNGQSLAQQATITIAPLNVPDRVFRARLWPQPEIFVMDEAAFRKQFPLDEYHNESRPEEWKADAATYQQSFTSNKEGVVNIPAGTFKSGWYLVTVAAKDKSSGGFVEDRKYIEVTGNGTHEPLSIVPDKAVYQPGQTAKATISSGFKEAFILQQETSMPDKSAVKTLTYNNTPLTWSKTITEADRGGISLQWLMIKDNRVYTAEQTIAVPWSNKDLHITWATHRDKLAPGAKETWTVTISGNKKEKVAAELLAGMYDASLDAFKPHSWSIGDLFPVVSGYTSWNKEGGFGIAYNRQLAIINTPEIAEWNKAYENLIISGNDQYSAETRMFRSPGRRMELAVAASPAPPAGNIIAEKAALQDASIANFSSGVPARYGDATGGIVKKEPQDIPLRKNLQETAFFFPQLKTNAAGDVTFSFTLPEALTEWKFMALAHTKDMAIGQLTGTVKTQKDLMVQPNLPRFFRQGDELIITTKISNLSAALLNGTASLTIVEAQTLQPANTPFRLKDNTVSFSAAKGQSTTASWRIHVPESRYEPVLIRITAQAGNFTDGEENMLPVLTNRTLVTETLPLWMNGTGTKQFTFDKLLHSDTSKTLAQHRLTVEYTANPAWYAVQALPYLMEYPYECAEQTFNRYYANSLAAHILDKAPRVKQVFAQWKMMDTAALQSNLQKNEELKSALLEETPWVMAAEDEATQRHNIALLFDSYKLAASQDAALKKLNDMLLPEGAFPWFKGGSHDRYITQYIATGIARLQHLGVSDEKAADLQQKMQAFLDRQLTADYEALIKAKAKMEEQQIGYVQIQYLYMRSFSTNALPENKTAFNYYRQQAAKYWPQFNPYLKGMIALALNRTGDKNTPAIILQSLRETAVHKEEMGMYWMAPGAGYWWYEAPVEAQSLLVECFSEVAHDTATTDELKRWLLKQKQTQNWSTTKATADACYALLLNGSQWLTNTPSVSIRLGDKMVTPSKSESGTGYFKQAFAAGETNSGMGNVTITTSQSGNAATGQPSYGAVYWQYFENFDKITSAATPLALRKQLFIVRNSDRGPVLEELTDGHTLKVGDQVKVRIILQADRDMEYLHLKDMRAAAFEPVNVLSGYHWQGGLGYYESTRDASSNFFISYLPKGTYVFEYPVNVMAKGDFSNGISTIQCMYAPEFTSHSEGLRVHVE